MATRKELTSYFPHDSNARNSDKLIRLRMRHKAAGYGVYFMILERLREEPEYTSVKDMETRSHTDNFGENNVKCLIAKGICRFVPHSSAGGF